MAELLIQMVQRAKTFQIFKWHFRSNVEFNPYLLASQGYECVGLNTLECIVCHNKVLFNTEEGTERSFDELLKDLSNHESSCEYHGQTGQLPTRSELYLRIDQLLKLTKKSHKDSHQKTNETSLERHFPILNFRKFESMIQESGKKDLIKQIFNKFKINPCEIKISFLLTLLGWARTSGEQLQCSFCGRVLNIKQQFKTTFEDKLKIDTIDYSQTNLFDPFEQHRYFCFWVNDIKGWQVYLQHLYDLIGEADELFRGKNPEQIKKIRILIDGYFQNFINQTGGFFQGALKMLEECQQMVEQMEDNQDFKEARRTQILERRKELSRFLDSIESQVRRPLKKVKID